MSTSLGQSHYPRKRLDVTPAKPAYEPEQELVGIDVFVQARLRPHGAPETYCTDHWRCRFKVAADHIGELDNRQVLSLLERLDLDKASCLNKWLPLKTGSGLAADRATLSAAR